MAKIQRFLFVSIDGMTDPLGQAQVLPYLVNLAKKGFKIDIASCEKKENWALNHLTIESLIKGADISWEYCFYRTGMPFISQLQNYRDLKKLVVKKIQSNDAPTALHCRSYLPGLIGLYCKQKFKIGFIFDMRGFWADERIEGGIWNKKNPLSSFLFSYFKKKEKEMLKNSDSIVCLTNKAKSVILKWDLAIAPDKITVIPCCADLDFFSMKNIDVKILTQLREKLPLLKGKFVLTYIGSLGTWYMMDEMLNFFKALSAKTHAIFMVITKDQPEMVYHAAKKYNILPGSLMVTAASRAEMPYYISLSAASLFFIKPTFSKSASSPTKMGELLSMGIPIVTNTGVGDVDDIITEMKCGVTISRFDEKAYQEAAADLLLHCDQYKKNTVKTAFDYFSLNDGVEKYELVYSSLNVK